jgi:hypothetical protein
MASKPFVMILALAGDTIFADSQAYLWLLQAIHAKAHITTASTEADALQHLKTSDLAAVLATDCQIAGSPLVLTALIEYAKSGRPVVFGCSFGSYLPPSDFPIFFGDWGVHWKSGSFTGEGLSYNTAVNALFKDDARLSPSLPPMPGQYLTGFELGDAVYLKKLDENEDGPHNESNISPTTREQPAESPIVYTRMGKGYMGYVAFANGEQKVIEIIVAMLRL